MPEYPLALLQALDRFYRRRTASGTHPSTETRHPMTGYDEPKTLTAEASLNRAAAIGMPLPSTVSPTPPLQFESSFGTHIITGYEDDFGGHQDEIDRLATMTEDERDEWLSSVQLRDAGPLLSRVNSVTDEHRARANRSEGLGDWIRSRFGSVASYGSGKPGQN